MGIAIPRNFGQTLESGHGAEVQLLVDGSDSNTSSIAIGYAESIVRLYSASVRVRNVAPPRPPAGRSPHARLVQQLARIENYVVPG